MALARVRKTIPYRAAAEHIDKNFQKLEGVLDRLEHLEHSHEQLYSGCMAEGIPNTLSTGAGDRFRRNFPLGHSTGTFTKWTPVSTCPGFDIWRYYPDDYNHDPTNVLFMDSDAMTYRGLATSEQLTQFDKVYEEDGGVATDETSEAASRYGAAFTGLEALADYIYVGHSETFGALTSYMQVFGLGVVLELEYWNGSAWTTISDAAIADGTNAFQRDGKLSWTVPSDWATSAYQSVTKYWLRISTTIIPVQAPTFYAIVPAESVLALLFVDQLAASRGDYPWCTFGTGAYIGIANSGNADYEGVKFIRSGSSATRLYSYFVKNHEFAVSYETYSWTGGGLSLAQRIRNIEG